MWQLALQRLLYNYEGRLVSKLHSDTLFSIRVCGIFLSGMVFSFGYGIVSSFGDGLFINTRRACAAWVTVFGLCVCVHVCPCVCVSP